jgi:hypothetical protein
MGARPGRQGRKRTAIGHTEDTDQHDSAVDHNHAIDTPLYAHEFVVFLYFDEHDLNL